MMPELEAVSAAVRALSWSDAARWMLSITAVAAAWPSPDCPPPCSSPW
jgi:hypothetical protein